MAMQTRRTHRGISLKQIPDSGLVDRDDGGIVWAYFWEADKKVFTEDAELITPLRMVNKRTGKRLYVKRFDKITVYLRGEYEMAVKHAFGDGPEDPLSIEEILQNSLVIGYSGYSDLSPDDCAEFDMKVGSWERTAKSFMTRMFKDLRTKFPTLRMLNVNGAVYRGVDMVQIQVARALNIPWLGFNYTGWLWQVRNEPQIIFAGSTQEEYSEMYIHTLDILGIMNGRGTTFLHDIQASMDEDKIVMMIDVIELTTGKPTKVVRKGKKILDAVGAWKRMFVRLYDDPNPSLEGALNHYIPLIRHAVTQVIRDPGKRFDIGHMFSLIDDDNS